MLKAAFLCSDKKNDEQINIFFCGSGYKQKFDLSLYYQVSLVEKERRGQSKPRKNYS